MAKVVGIVALELNPGFTDEQVRELATDTIREFRVPGVVNARLGQGIRGDRQGNYALIWEFESVETMERYFPMPSTPSDEWERKTAGAPAAILERYFTLFTMSYTDYVVLGE